MVPFTTIHLVAAVSPSVIPPLGIVAPKGTVPVENHALLRLSLWTATLSAPGAQGGDHRG